VALPKKCVVLKDGRRTQVTISLRVPAELKARLEGRAAANHRNLSQEAERALERSFSPEALLEDAMSVKRKEVEA
jgi:predicted transcriptional regulator